MTNLNNIIISVDESRGCAELTSPKFVMMTGNYLRWVDENALSGITMATSQRSNIIYISKVERPKKINKKILRITTITGDFFYAQFFLCDSCGLLLKIKIVDKYA